MGITTPGLRLLLLLTVLGSCGFAADADPAALVESGHLRQARTILDKQLAANPKDANALVLMARVKLEAADADGAQKLLEQAIAIQPNNSDAHLYLADAYSRRADQAGMFEKMGLAKKIKKETDQAISLNPKNLNALEGLMQFYLEAPGMMGGSRSNAEETADKIMALDPERGNLAKAEIAVHEKEYDKVEGLFLKALESSPRSYRVLIQAAALYSGERWQNADKSIAYAQKAVQADPTRAEGYTILAQMYALKERWPDLDQVLAKAEKAIPDNFAPYYQAGRTLLISGKDNPRAERYFRRYLTQEPELNAPPLAGAHWRLGLVLEKEGRKQEAIQEIQTAVQMRPDLKEAQKDLKRLKG